MLDTTCAGGSHARRPNRLGSVAIFLHGVVLTHGNKCVPGRPQGSGPLRPGSSEPLFWSFIQSPGAPAFLCLRRHPERAPWTPEGIKERGLMRSLFARPPLPNPGISGFSLSMELIGKLPFTACTTHFLVSMVIGVRNFDPLLARFPFVARTWALPDDPFSFLHAELPYSWHDGHSLVFLRAELAFGLPGRPDGSRSACTQWWDWPFTVGVFLPHCSQF
jgi:hypothetical protein